MVHIAFKTCSIICYYYVIGPRSGPVASKLWIPMTSMWGKQSDTPIMEGQDIYLDL